MIPTFAVVGHPNKGKSSIVATLAENDAIPIAPMPRTTRRAHTYTLSIDGEAQYVLVDTPGFQRARAVLDWLEEGPRSAADRPDRVTEFVQAHRDDERFHDEVALLQPIVEGAGILYVVDGSKPYGSEYEVEMQVLQWTGQPRMALINLIGSDDYIEQWRRALDQYFSIVRVFDAVRADFGERLTLLRAFCELEEDWRSTLMRAVEALGRERQRRLVLSARETAALLADALSFTERRRLKADTHKKSIQAELVERLRRRISTREREAREQVQQLYRHSDLEREEAAAEILDTDLFTAEGWELFGLSKRQLVASGVASGALLGTGFDALVGGASLLLGATLGALVGGTAAWLGGNELARVQVLGHALGGRVLKVGPVTAPNLPWVLIGRAWVHHHLVAEHNHARREAVSLALAENTHLMDALPEPQQRELARRLEQLSKGSDGEARESLARSLAKVFAMSP